MKRLSACFLLAIISFALHMQGQQQTSSSAAPWREGKPMSPVQMQNTGQDSQPVGDIQNYAPYNIALLPDRPGAEIVLPFFTSENKLAFFSLSQVQQASKDKRVLGRLISYGELISLIGDLQIQVNQLKQENEKLWATLGKPSTPQTAVVQPAAPPPQQNRSSDALAKYLLLRQLFPTPQPYMQPMPTAPNSRGLNCTTRYIGTTAYTSCN